MGNIIIPTTDEIDLVLRRMKNQVLIRNEQEYRRALENNILGSRELPAIVNLAAIETSNITDAKEYTIAISIKLFRAGLQVGLDIKRGFN